MPNQTTPVRVISLLTLFILPLVVTNNVIADEMEEVQQLLPSDGSAYTWFGSAVDISGNTAVIGRYGDGAGSAYVFEFDGSNWIESAKLEPDDGVAGNNFGGAVAIDGDTIIVGAKDRHEVASYAGAAYVFVREQENWIQQDKLVPDDANTNDRFGKSVDISGDSVIVGAENKRVGISSVGAAYVFTRNGTTWTQEQRLYTDDETSGGGYGFSVAIDGDSVAVGAPDRDTGGINQSGAAYVFRRVNSVWSEEYGVTPQHPDQFDRFGESVSLSGGTLFVGIRDGDEEPIDTSDGAVEIFGRSGNAWLFRQHITSGDVSNMGAFGGSLSVDGNRAVITAQGRYWERCKLSSFATGGIAFKYHYDGAMWNLFSRRKATTAKIAASLSGSTVVIGSPEDYEDGSSAGAAYIYGQVGRPLLMRRSTDGRWFRYQLGLSPSGSTIVDKGRPSLSRNLAYQTVSTGDFNGDGKPDVLMRDVAGTENGRWIMGLLDGSEVISKGEVDIARNPDWQLIATEDFDGDCKTDVLVRNSIDGRWLLYLLDGQSIKEQGFLGLSEDLADVYAGTGDFNGDYNNDLLLRRSDGSWLMYLVDGLAAQQESTPPLPTDKNLSIVTIADFNTGGSWYDDILFRHSDGHWELAIINNAFVDDVDTVPMTTNLQFEFVAAEDFDGNKSSDVLLRRTDGRWFLYNMDGLSVVSQGSLPMTENPDFHPEMVRDFDGDGKSDVLLRRTDGRWVLYGINGADTSITVQSIPDMSRNDNWEIQ